MRIEESLLFPTPVWSVEIPDEGGMRADLLEFVRRLREEDPTGVQKSNLGGWQSASNLHHRPEFAPFGRFLQRIAATIAERFEIREGHVLVIQNAWANVNGYGHANAPHIHAGSALSGAYYVQVPEAPGDLEILDPRGLAVASRIHYPQARENHLTQGRVAYTPAEGRLVLFPGWVQHYVHPNRSQQERIGFSFNMAFVRRDQLTGG